MSFFNGWIIFGQASGVRQPALPNTIETADTPLAITIDQDEAEGVPLPEPTPTNWLSRTFASLRGRIQSSTLLHQARRVGRQIRDNGYTWSRSFLLATYRITGIMAALYLFADEYLIYFFGWDLNGQYINATIAADSKGPGFFFPLKMD